MKTKPETQMDDYYAICPYCLYKNHVEGEDYNCNERKEVCAECGSTFLQYEDFTVTHYTRPINPAPASNAEGGAEF